MKKFLFVSVLSFGMLFFSSTTVFAGDCFQDPIYDRDWNAEVTTGAFIRDVACMEGSTVTTTLSVGTVVHVIAETDGWYKIETSDGLVGWVGQWLIVPTGKPFASSGKVEVCDVVLCDVEGHKNETAIRYLYNEGIISGYPDGSFKPEATVNRAELIKILVEGNGITPLLKDYSNCFIDVKTDWYAPYVCYALNQGWIDGYPDGTFKPAQTVNKVEALKMLLNAQNVYVSDDSDDGFDDVAKSDWFYKYVATANDFGILEESGSKYYPAAGMRRASISESLYRLLIAEG